MDNKIDEISMMIITYAGTAKSLAMQAIEEAEEGNFDEIDAIFEEAEENQTLAGKEHFKVLGMEESERQLNVLFIHAEDQMLSSETTINLAKKMVFLHKKIDEKCK